jgi:hypothetical protein
MAAPDVFDPVRGSSNTQLHRLLFWLHGMSYARIQIEWFNGTIGRSHIR